MSLDVTIVGGGMITHDLILPSVYHMQRTGIVNTIHVCSLDSGPLKLLKESTGILEGFPGQDFIAHPALSEPDDKKFPELYKEVLSFMKPRQVVVVAMPDQLHYPVIMEALKQNQHILCVKPLVLKYAQTVEIEKLALEKGLFIGVEYHKRFDRRALMARRSYEQNLEMFFEGDGKTGMIKHNDQNRGVEHAYLEGIGCAGSYFNYVSPDFYRLIPWEGEGYKPTGYGYESVEAARLSILNDGDWVSIEYGTNPKVTLRS